MPAQQGCDGVANVSVGEASRKKTEDQQGKEQGKHGRIVEREVVKYASVHDLRRSFGTRWAKRVMPVTLNLLMRHSSIDTTMRCYVEMDAHEVAADLWAQYRPKEQEKPGLGTVLRPSVQAEAQEESEGSERSCPQPLADNDS